MTTLQVPRFSLPSCFSINRYHTLPRLFYVWWAHYFFFLKEKKTYNFEEKFKTYPAFRCTKRFGALLFYLDLWRFVDNHSYSWMESLGESKLAYPTTLHKDLAMTQTLAFWSKGQCADRAADQRVAVSITSSDSYGKHQVILLQTTCFTPPMFLFLTLTAGISRVHMVYSNVT